MTTTAEIGALQTAMVDEVRACGYAWRPGVERTLRVVPRRAFIPEASPEAAFDAHKAFVTKRASDGVSLSSASAPTIVAMMLDQLDVQPGHRVLEVGAGTGYNAALLAELVGPHGEVVTVDIDPEATTRTRAALTALGYDVRVLTCDGALGAPGHGVFDRIIVTAGVWDVPPAWTDQLAPDGRLVLPLRWRGQTRSVAFTQADDQCLRSDGLGLCGFIPLTGPTGERTHPLDTDATATLTFDDDQDIAPEPLHDILARPSAQLWSGVVLAPMTPFDGVWMRMATTEPRAARVAADPDRLTATGRPRPYSPLGTSCIVEGDSLALFCYRRLPDDERTAEEDSELGALGFGPAGHDLAQRVLDAIHVWDADRATTATFTLLPADTPDTDLPAGTVIDKHHRRLVISYAAR